jgi:uncharacterized integral membrane protein (TIGR00697 family)
MVTVMALVLSNIFAARLFQVGALYFSTGDVLFPVCYIASDLLSEVYGYHASRRSAMYAFLINGFVMMFFKVVTFLPAPDVPEMLEFTAMFDTVFESNWRMVAASLCAFFVGDWVNDVVFQQFKKKHGVKKYGLRAIVSSVIGQALDTIIFAIVAFGGVYAIQDVFTGSFLAKVGCEIVTLPVAYVLVKKLQRVEGDVFEQAKGFSIL